MATREQPTSRRFAWPFATTAGICLVTAASCSRPCEAYVALSPTGGRELQLTHVERRLCRRLGASRVEVTPANQDHSNIPGGKEEVELRLLTWIEVEDRIKREIAKTGTAAVIVPVGATEQHGPNGLIGTDHMTAEAVARGVSEATGALLAPSINYGMSHHHESFPGTVTLRPATFVAVVRDVASSLSRTGFTHVLFVNGHGGNVGPAFKAFTDLAAGQQRGRKQDHDESTESTGGGSTARVKLVSWYAGRESSTLAKELYGSELGQHATPDEVAMTQHLFPDSIKVGVELDPAAIQVAKDLGGMTKRFKDEETGLSVMDVQDFRRRFPDGRMFSNPGLATPEHGRRLLEAAVRDVVEALGHFLSGQDLTEEAEAKSKRAAAMEAAQAAEEKKTMGKASFSDDDSGRGGDRGRIHGGDGGGGGGGVQQAECNREGAQQLGPLSLSRPLQEESRAEPGVSAGRLPQRGVTENWRMREEPTWPAVGFLEVGR